LAETQWRDLGPFQEIISIPSTGVDPSEVFSLAMDRLTRLLVVDRAVLFMLEADGEHLRPRASRGFRPDDLTNFSVAAGEEGIVGRAFREGRPVVYSTPLGAPPADPFLVKFPVRDAIALPIRSEGAVKGVLYVGRRGRPALFTVEEIQILMLVADRVGAAVVYARLLNRLSGQVERLKELARLAARISVRLDLTEVLSAACETAVRLLHLRSAAIVLVEGEGHLSVRGSYGFAEGTLGAGKLPRGEGLISQVVRTGQPALISDLYGDSAQTDPFLQGLGVRTILIFPIRLGEEIAGCLVLADQAARQFSADEMETAALLATQAAIAVENTRLYGELRQAYDELKAAQEQLVQSEKVRALGEMAGGIAHDFNNILAIVLGKTQLMLERYTDAALREDLGIIEEAAWRAAETVRRLQGFASLRAEEGRSPLDLNALVMDAVALMRPRWKDEAEARGIRVEVTTDLGDIPSVFGNPADLRELVTNLIVNALDAMPEGGRLTFTTSRVNDAVEIVVADTGVGMPEDVRRRAFDPFFTTRSPERAGLGLSVVHGVVARHKGVVEVQSEEGRGTTFRVKLPIPSQDFEPLAVAPSTPAAGAPQRAAVLVIEDEEHLRTMLVQILTSVGHSVEAASDGLSGLARFQKGRFDVVFTDLSMPELSGLEVAQAIKKMNPAVPVILLTGWGDQIDPLRVRDSGVDLMVAKPFRVERVLSALGDALALRGLSK
jgi:signal transduction histidine kinase/CheY-like chemotaxis protein